MKNPLTVSCLCVTALLGACGDDQGVASVDEGSTTASTGGPGDEVGDEASDASSTGAAESTGDEPTTGEPVGFTPIPARGDVRIVRVEANPGVAVPIGLLGQEVGGKDRNAHLPRERDTMVRVYVDVPDGWVPRELEARLVLSGGGVDATHTQRVTITEDSDDAVLDSGFYFGIPAEQMQPGLRYQVSLWETAPGQEDLPEPAEAAVAPLTGTAIVGVESERAVMRIVVVPIDYSFGACAKVVDGESHRKALEDAMFQENPLQELELEFHAPYKVTYDMTSMSGLSQLVDEMSQLRTEDAADPSVYYFGLFDNCSQCIAIGGLQKGCTVGLAADITGPDVDDARFRASAGQLNAGFTDTFVHEVGHTQGRQHIDCAGAGVPAQGTDPSYPHEDGRIGVWGFGVRDFKLRHPTVNSDYMSYCDRAWVSDWQWNATFKRITTLSAWDMADAAPPASGGVLIGAVDPDGEQRWWTGPGALSPGRELSATHKVVFEFADGEVEAVAQVSVRSHYATRNIVAPLPVGFDGRELLGVRLRDDAGEHPVAAASIRRLHGPMDLKAAQ